MKTLLTICLSIFGWVFAFYWLYRYSLLKKNLDDESTWQQQLNNIFDAFEKKQLADQHHAQQAIQTLQQQYLSEQQKYQLAQQTHITKSMQDVRLQLQTALKQHGETLDKPLKRLSEHVEQKLHHISQRVDQRLEDGFAKTNQVFTDVVKRLAQIDSAQKRIQTLSESIVDLQSLLNDKRTRGAFGEVQLATLIRNMVPEQHFKLQHTLSNGKRVDCLLLLPPPTGDIAIDAKFPLESYQLMQNNQDSTQMNLHNKQFKQDILVHIKDIAQKYILPNETAGGAIMFIPAEAIFSYIHSNHPDLVALAQRANVWLASPTTMMAILTTATTVLKDIETRQQVHEIQKHLGYLSDDFTRFRKRMDNLYRHIQQAHTDLQQVHTSSEKISKRFNAIESVNFSNIEPHSRIEQESH